MLTDIFADRYASVPLWSTFGDRERRLIVQTFRILSEQICPYYTDGKETERSKDFWRDIQSKTAMELGFKVLHPVYFTYTTQRGGQSIPQTGTRTMQQVCEGWALTGFDGSTSADQFIKQRLSLVELGFRKRGEEIAVANANLPATPARSKPIGRTPVRVTLSGLGEDWRQEQNAAMNKQFATSVEELNTRFRQAGCSLHYHNGYIQMAKDALTTQQIEEPFWHLLTDSKWKNVDTDIKEAIDLRDAGGRDPAFYAARALESTIKIISDAKGWTNGKERGAHNYIENLASKTPGFLSPWESQVLKDFFTKVRNPLGYGPGNEPMPTLTPQQTDWAIETSMIWIKSLLRRL